MGTPAEFRRNADECVELAKNTNNAVHKELLLGLAAKWLQLAGMTHREIELIRKVDEQAAAYPENPQPDFRNCPPESRNF
jgi:hypothetical protein